MKVFRRFITTSVVVMILTAAVHAADQRVQDLYKSKCQGCHGADGKASAMGKKLGARDFQDPDVASMSEDDLAKVTKDGKGKMPAYKGKLNDKQIDELVQYIKQMK